jgi:signal transduction histidine kinase
VATVKMLMASAGAGGNPNEAQNLDISFVVEQVLAMAKYSFPKNATLRLNLGKHLKPVCGNLLEIRQVIMNLLLNSIEALDDKQGEITISSEDYYLERGAAEADNLPQGEYVCLKFSDTGRGISGDIRKRIFDQFFTTKPGGRGLGLSVVHGIVQSHNGVVRVASAPGEGATLEVLLPCAKSAEASRA